MRVSNNLQTKNNTHFGVVRMSPVPEKWDQRVLRAVLNSDTITDIIKANEKIGKETELRYHKYNSPRYPEIPSSDDVYFRVKGEKGEVSLSSHATYKYIPGSFFENKKEKEVQHGPKDIVMDLVNQINQIDHRTIDSPCTKTFEYLKSIASKIIYEPEVKVDPYA